MAGRVPHPVGTFGRPTPPRKQRNGTWRTTARYYGAWGIQYIERTGPTAGEAGNRLAEAIRDFRPPPEPDCASPAWPATADTDSAGCVTGKLGNCSRAAMVADRNTRTRRTFPCKHITHARRRCPAHPRRSCASTSLPCSAPSPNFASCRAPSIRAAGLPPTHE